MFCHKLNLSDRKYRNEMRQSTLNWLYWSPCIIQYTEWQFVTFCDPYLPIQVLFRLLVDGLIYRCKSTLFVTPDSRQCTFWNNSLAELFLFHQYETIILVHSTINRSVQLLLVIYFQWTASALVICYLEFIIFSTYFVVLGRFIMGYSYGGAVIACD